MIENRMVTSIIIDRVKWKKFHIKVVVEDTTRSAILDKLIEGYLNE